MPRGHPWTHCRRCEKSRQDAGSLSRRGLCFDCGTELRNDNLLGLVTHSGPYFDHWRRQCLAAFGAAPLDETPRGG